MSRGRKYGCPVNIKNWTIEILDPNGTNEYVRINGLSSMSKSIGGDTEDGSAESASWAEPYITKRNGAISLEGKPVVYATTGEVDIGQSILDEFAEKTGCDADATIKMSDPYGHTMIADYIVESREEGADGSGSTLSYELAMVGEPEYPPYVHVSTVSFKDGELAVTTLSLAVGAAPKLISIVFNPEDASNKRFRIGNSNKRVATVANITENSFSVVPVSAGSTTITLTTVNGEKTAQLAVTITGA
ncbi:MAG: hypothetical protein GX483_09000 [Actinomycetaceae bacterium]|nr:hypothetical protein [Actinomycetaceae bacterium]